MTDLKVEVAFMGLCLFVTYAGIPGRTVVIPDLSSSTSVVTPRGATCVEPHLAYIAAATKDIASCDMHGNREIMMLGSDQLTIEGIGDPSYEEAVNYTTTIPSMATTCPSFRLAQPLPATATKLKIDKGALSAEIVAGTDERYSVLTVTSERALLTFRATHDGVSRTMVIRPPAQTIRVEIGNRYANGLRDTKVDPLALNHWLGLYSLAAAPVVCDLPKAGSVGTETTIACSNGTYGDAPPASH
jgi:hypothetical protein